MLDYHSSIATLDEHQVAQLKAGFETQLGPQGHAKLVEDVQVHFETSAMYTKRVQNMRPLQKRIEPKRCWNLWSCWDGECVKSLGSWITHPLQIAYKVHAHDQKLQDI